MKTRPTSSILALALAFLVLGAMQAQAIIIVILAIDRSFVWSGFSKIF